MRGKKACLFETGFLSVFVCICLLFCTQSENARRAFSKANNSIKPRPTPAINSPAPTVSVKNQMASVSPYTKRRTHGTMIIFARRLGKGMRNLRNSDLRLPLHFLTPLPIIYAPSAPIRVARAPKRISNGRQPVRRFAIAHPMNRPGMAAGVNNGKMHSASEIRTCITPDARPTRADT